MLKAHSRKIISSLRTGVLMAPVCAAALVTAPNTAAAVTVGAYDFDLFLISEHSSPTAPTAPTSITTSTAYLLDTFNSTTSGAGASGYSDADNFTFSVDGALNFNQVANGVADPNEAGSGDAAYTNAEISTWDNVNTPNDGIYDATEQLDMGRNTRVTFDAVQGGLVDLVIADLGGLNPFALRLCPDAACTTFTEIFSGLNRSLTSTILGLSDFAVADDGSEGGVDQTWLFRFAAPMLDYIQVVEFDDRKIFTSDKNARLQLDFIGFAGPAGDDDNGDPSIVPLPAGLPLMISALGLMLWTRRRTAA